MIENSDTICAASTAPGGAIAVIRISGPQALSLLETFQDGGHQEAMPLNHGRSRLMTLRHEGQILDEAVVTAFHAPHSYTGQDTVEISCHGSQYITDTLLRHLVSAGARLAQPGEYTRRAYMNGKLDLAQAEAVADLIAARSKAAHTAALSQLRGHLSQRLDGLRDQLLSLMAAIQLQIDFSDQPDVDVETMDNLATHARKIADEIDDLLRSFTAGQAVRQGINVVLMGCANVGKSTLLNRIVGDDRAIVSDIPGTTRDTLDDTADIHGATFRFTDTAGIRPTSDPIETIGIDRARRAIRTAHIIVWVIDRPVTSGDLDETRILAGGKPVIVVRNKTDIADFQATGLPADWTQIPISAKTGYGIDLLKDAVWQAAQPVLHTAGAATLTSARHFEALTSARRHLDTAIGTLSQSLSPEIAAEDLSLVLDDISQLTGRGAVTSQETLNHIFEHFCIGK